MPINKKTSNNWKKFPTTQWKLIVTASDSKNEDNLKALNTLIELYWKPTYYFVRRRGYQTEIAEDIVQEFFTSWLQKKTYSKANFERGRFRTFLLSCLENFIKNKHRDENRKQRQPSKGIVSIHALRASDNNFEIPDVKNETPRAIFNRAWATEIILRVLNVLSEECKVKQKNTHYELLRRRVIDPLLHGSEEPSLKELAREFYLTEKEASNRIVTMRRACQRLLREEVKKYTNCEEEVTAEINDIFQFLK